MIQIPLIHSPNELMEVGNDVIQDLLKLDPNNSLRIDKIINEDIALVIKKYNAKNAAANYVSELISRKEREIRTEKTIRDRQVLEVTFEIIIGLGGNKLFKKKLDIYKLGSSGELMKFIQQKLGAFFTNTLTNPKYATFYIFSASIGDTYLDANSLFTNLGSSIWNNTELMNAFCVFFTKETRESLLESIDDKTIFSINIVSPIHLNRFFDITETIEPIIFEKDDKANNDDTMNEYSMRELKKMQLVTDDNLREIEGKIKGDNYAIKSFRLAQLLFLENYEFLLLKELLNQSSNLLWEDETLKNYLTNCRMEVFESSFFKQLLIKSKLRDKIEMLR